MPLRRPTAAIALWLTVLAAAVALSVLAATNDRLPADLWIARQVQDVPSPAKPLSDTVRAITGTEVVLATGAAAALVLWLRGYRRQAVLLAAGLVLLPLLSFSVKEAVDRPRPDPDLVVRRAGFDSPSFPSGHVTASTLLYGYLLYLSARLSIARAGRWALAAASLLVLSLAALANVYLGVHWPSDVLGGWLWASALLLPLLLADLHLNARPLP